jgi:hypothetical protein
MKAVDVKFLIIFILLVLLVLGIYFINPILNVKKYAKAREELETREKIYHENRNNED